MLPTKFRFIWQSGFRGEDYSVINQSEKKDCLWWPCLLTELDEMSNLYRGPPIDAFYQVSVHFAKGFREHFQKSTNQKQELPVAAMFINGAGHNDQSLQRTLHRWFLPSFSSFDQTVSEKICQLSTNQKQELHLNAMFVNGSGRNEQPLQKTFHRCFLPSFGSFVQAVSNEKIFQKLTNQKQELPMAAIFVKGSEENEQC